MANQCVTRDGFCSGRGWGSNKFAAESCSKVVFPCFPLSIKIWSGYYWMLVQRLQMECNCWDEKFVRQQDQILYPFDLCPFASHSRYVFFLKVIPVL